jgi:hypothetical protein
MAQPTTLATGQITRSDQLSVELHTPAVEPAFVLVRWPAAPSVASADDDSFDRLVAAVYRVLADARTTLTRMRGDRRTR